MRDAICFKYCPCVHAMAWLRRAINLSSFLKAWQTVTDKV